MRFTVNHISTASRHNLSGKGNFVAQEVRWEKNTKTVKTFVPLCLGKTYSYSVLTISLYTQGEMGLKQLTNVAYKEKTLNFQTIQAHQ